MPTNPVERGNHDGGVIRFGPDGKLYVFVGDVGRRGWMQNLENGPFAPGDPSFGTDDQFGGPEPDDAHLTGVVLRLNDDGSTPDGQPLRGPRPRLRGATRRRARRCRRTPRRPRGSGRSS